MPAHHLLASDHKVDLGGCTNHSSGIRVHRAPAVHFPSCEPGDCYCLVAWGDECEPTDHGWVALSRRVVLCERCKSLPERPLTHGQLKHARDLKKASRKRVIAVRYSKHAMGLDKAYTAALAATTPEEKDAADGRVRARPVRAG